MSSDVHIRGGFSDRNGIQLENTKLQYDDFDERTRIALINTINEIIYMYKNGVSHGELVYYSSSDRKNIQYVIKSIIRDVYSQEALCSENYWDEEIFDLVRETIREDSYNAVLDVIEYVASTLARVYNREDSYKLYNMVFEKEYVGYRFVNGKITLITDENEIKEIEKVNKVKIDAVSQHINKALSYLANRETPDYEKSIKESISAVEAMCHRIVGRKTTLGKALKQLEQNNIVIHPSLKEGFDKIYDYTYDEKGIRHVGCLGVDKVTYAEAQLMIVMCSSFINYLKSFLQD